MRRPFVPFLLLFLVGILVGNLASSMGFVLVTPDNGQIETVSAPAEGGRHGDALTQVGVAAKSGQRPSSVQNANARVGNIGNFITDLPPHLALPDFFGPDPQDPEVILQREQAAEDFLDSLKGNISEEDIALMDGSSGGRAGGRRNDLSANGRTA